MGAGRQRLPQAGPEVRGSGPAVLRPAGQGGPTARPECSWPTSAGRDGPWWTKGFICRSAGPRTPTAVRRREYRRRVGTTGRKPSWRWSCWRGPWRRGHLKAGWVAGDDAFGMSPSLRGGTGGAGDALRAGRSRHHHGLAAGASLDQSGVSGDRASPPAWAGGRAAAHHGGAQCRIAGGRPGGRLRWRREARVPAATSSAPSGCVQPVRAYPNNWRKRACPLGDAKLGLRLDVGYLPKRKTPSRLVRSVLGLPPKPIPPPARSRTPTSCGKCWRP